MAKDCTGNQGQHVFRAYRWGKETLGHFCDDHVSEIMRMQAQGFTPEDAVRKLILGDEEYDRLEGEKVKGILFFVGLMALVFLGIFLFDHFWH